MNIVRMIGDWQEMLNKIGKKGVCVKTHAAGYVGRGEDRKLRSIRERGVFVGRVAVNRQTGERNMKKSILLLASAVLISAGLARADVINLPVVNHSFEDPVGGTTSGAPGWTQSGTTQFKVTNPGFPVPDGVQRLEFSVTGSSGTYEGYASQIIDISSYASNIDLGGGTATFVFYNRTGDVANDSANGALEFFDEFDQSLGSPTTTSWFKNESWTPSSIADAAIPVDARSLKITLGARRTSGTQTNIYFDNISVSLAGVTIPEPATLGMVWVVGIAMLMRRRIVRA